MILTVKARRFVDVRVHANSMNQPEQGCVVMMWTSCSEEGLVLAQADVHRAECGRRIKWSASNPLVSRDEPWYDERIVSTDRRLTVRVSEPEGPRSGGKQRCPRFVVVGQLDACPMPAVSGSSETAVFPESCRPVGLKLFAL